MQNLGLHKISGSVFPGSNFWALRSRVIQTLTECNEDTIKDPLPLCIGKLLTVLFLLKMGQHIDVLVYGLGACVILSFEILRKSRRCIIVVID